MALDIKGFSKQVGILLHNVRKRRSLTQEQLAERIGIPRATYASIELGRQRAALDVIWRAAIALDVPLTELAPEYQAPVEAAGSESGATAPGISTRTLLSSLMKVGDPK